MLTIAWYLLKVMLVSAVLFGYYLVALRNKRFHQYNRFYLLAATVFSWLIPLVKINFLQETADQSQVIKLFTVVANGDFYVEHTHSFKWDWNLTVIIMIAAVSAIFFTQLITALQKIKRLIANNPGKKWNEIYFVFTNDKSTPFSFFKYIFWNDQIDLKSTEGEQILKHELAHVQENHSVDKLFLSLMLVISWYNPFTWLTRKELNIIHEFIADKKAVDAGDTSAFAKMLIKAAYPNYSFPLANSFYYSPIKRRLLMLTSSKKTSFTYARRLAALPLLMVTCLLFAFTIKKGKAFKAASKTEKALVIEKTNASRLLNVQGQITDEESNYQDTSIKKKRTNPTRITVEKGTEANSTIFEGEQKATVKSANAEQLSKTWVVLDGKQMSWQEFSDKKINPNQINSMNVLKGESATTKYGEKGKNGVVEISLKKENSDQKNDEMQQKKFEAEKKNSESEQKDSEAARKKYGDEQKKQQEQSSYSRVFTVVENPPYYPGGMSEFAEYINRNMQYPKEALQDKVGGAVLIQFIVNDEGQLTDFKKLSSKGHGLEEEAIRLLKNSGEWNPGIQNGHKVVVQIQQQVIFKLPKQS